MSLNAPTTQASPFFRLPAELRNKIYTLALSPQIQTDHLIGRVAYVCLPKNRFSPLLRTNKQIHHEAGTLYCSLAEFVYFHLEDLCKFLAALSTPYRRAIRKMEFAGTDSTLFALKRHHAELLSCWFGPELHEDLELQAQPTEGELVSYRRRG